MCDGAEIHVVARGRATQRGDSVDVDRAEGNSVTELLCEEELDVPHVREHLPLQRRWSWHVLTKRLSGEYEGCQGVRMIDETCACLLRGRRRAPSIKVGVGSVARKIAEN